MLNVTHGYAFGCVIVSLQGFAMVKELLLNADLAVTLFSAVLTTNVMCGVLRIGFRQIDHRAAGADQWAQMATAAGIPLDASYH